MIERFFVIEEPRHTLTFIPSPDENFDQVRLSLPDSFLSDGRLEAAAIQIRCAVRTSCSFGDCDPLPIFGPNLGNGGGLVLEQAGFRCRTPESCPLQDLGGDEAGDNELLSPLPQQPGDRIAAGSL